MRRTWWLFLIPIVVAIGVLKTFPTFARVFADGGTLPGPTDFVLDVSSWAWSHKLLVIIGTVMLVVAGALYYRTPRGREFFAELLKPPGGTRPR